MRWEPIETAPRDGRAIWVMHEDVGKYLVAWNPVGTNEFFAPGDVGIWEALDKSFTWKAGEEDGPSHWVALAEAQEGEGM